MPSQNVTAYSFPQLESTVDADHTPDELLARAASEAEAIRAQAHAEGEAAGYAEGLERARIEASPSLEALAQAVRAIAETRDEVVESVTRQAGEISLLIAEQLVSAAFEVAPERVIDVTRAALRRLADRHRVTVLVNPDDLDLLSASVRSLQAELGGIEHLDVQADRRVERGGAIAQTAYGEIDASIGAQLRSARELVEAALAGDLPSAPQDDAEPGGAVVAGGL